MRNGISEFVWVMCSSIQRLTAVYWDSSKAVYHDIQNRAGKSVKPVIYFELPKQSLNSG